MDESNKSSLYVHKSFAFHDLCRFFRSQKHFIGNPRKKSAQQFGSRRLNLQTMKSSPRNDPLSLGRFRADLMRAARTELDPRVQAKLDASDVVQQTLLEAHDRRDQFSGDEKALASWLKKGLFNNIRDNMRLFRRGKRDLNREIELEMAVDQSPQRLFAAREPSPSQHAVLAEELRRLTAALDQLPDAQREAIIQHHLRGCSLSETAASMDRTEPAVAGLLRRGMDNLRELLSGDE